VVSDVRLTCWGEAHLIGQLASRRAEPRLLIEIEQEKKRFSEARSRRHPRATLSIAPPNTLSKSELGLASRDSWLLKYRPGGSKRKSAYFSSISCTKGHDGCQGLGSI